MSVKYHASTLTNLESDESKIDYKQPALDGSKFLRSVHSVRKTPFGVATVFLGLLCVLLLFVVIGQGVHYRKLDQDNQNTLTTLSKDKEDLQEKLKTEHTAERDIDTLCSQLTEKNRVLNIKISQLHTNYMILTEEQNTLKTAQSLLETSHAALSKEAEQLKASKIQLQTVNSALTKEKDLIQEQYNADLKQKNELHASYESVARERDILQNSFNNVSRSKNELRKSYLKLFQDLEKTQQRHNFSSIVKGKMETSHQALADELLKLKGNYDTLTARESIMQQNFSKIMSPSSGIECSAETEALERLQKTNDALTEERDRLQGEYDKLNATIHGKICPSGWRSFEYSCYFTYTVTKTWNQARESCQNQGAELAIVKTRQEMDFINGLFQSNIEAWIGLTDKGAEGQWIWVDGTPLTTTFWAKGQPNSHNGVNQDCVEFWHRGSNSGEWNDENCNLAQYFICEM
ncbi:uncharacterized protein LOC141808130 [Halichoeres trimaculatus]|uniref:uncharacterized protein LOC141808130 n=1 Tax=Halichoeres trimaculatus TaxID=147232 RepID=UPI003D9E8DC5